MPDFSADMNQLVKSARSWENAADDLSDGVGKAQAIQDCNKDVTWAVFQETWDVNVKAAQYIRERLGEGSKEMREMGGALNHVAKVLMEQDQNFARVLLQLDAE